MIFHYIWAALQVAGGLIGLAFIGIGIFLTSNPQVAASNTPPPPWFGAIFASIGALVMVACEAMAALTFFTAQSLSRRRNHTFCVVISAINCLSIPLGTALGVFTILVLLRPSVKQLFFGTAPQAGSPN